MCDSVFGFPIFLKGVDTNLSRPGDIGVEYFGYHATWTVPISQNGLTREIIWRWERTLGWSSREFLCELELDSEVTTRIWGAFYGTLLATVPKVPTRLPRNSARCPTWPFNYSCHIKHIIFVCLNTDALGWILPKFVQFTHEASEGRGSKRLGFRE